MKKEVNYDQHMFELWQLYRKELEQLQEKFNFEKDYIYSIMKDFIDYYDKEKYLKDKIAKIEKDLSEKVE